MDNKAILYQIEQQNQSHFMVLSEKLRILKIAILDCPDNQNIHRMSDRCYVMSFSQLGNSWSPMYYDFKAQYKLIVKEIEKCEINNVVKRLLDILNEGKIVLKSQHFSYTERLNPEAIQNVVTALGLKWQSNVVWPNGSIYAINDDYTTSDLHEKRSDAVAVCNMLTKDGLGGEGKIYPMRTSVEVTLCHL